MEQVHRGGQEVLSSSPCPLIHGEAKGRGAVGAALTLQ